ncbi:pirin family protein [Xanthomonas campestris]|uniref:pirin family protein n=1 Tax=Xanthomonas campestris TaxID=339 RepID=UPI001CBB5EDA|nr:pirin family protein [Xanthomonas campestris]
MNAQLASFHADPPSQGAPTVPSAARPRPVVFRTSGTRRGPITRLMSPGDLGQLVKPFVFLDLFTVKPTVGGAPMGMHPHSGIATLTYLMEGEVGYEDSTGKHGTLPSGGVEWMRAGNGVWHDGMPVGGASAVGFQLWVALPAAEENAPAQSQPMVESTVIRAPNSRSASPPLRGADNVRSLIQLRGLRPPVLPPRLRRSGRNFDPPERGACAPLPPTLPASPRALDETEAVPAAPSPQRQVSRG